MKMLTGIEIYFPYFICQIIGKNQLTAIRGYLEASYNIPKVRIPNRRTYIAVFVLSGYRPQIYNSFCKSIGWVVEGGGEEFWKWERGGKQISR